jgi:hypothetical protein
MPRPNRPYGGGGYFMMSGRGGGSKGTTAGSFQRNPYFGSAPGDVPYDLNVDPSVYASTPFLDTRSGWDKWKGATNEADELNAKVQLEDALLPIKEKEAKSKAGIDTDQYKTKLQAEKDLKNQELQEQNIAIANAILPMLMQNQQMDRIPTTAGGSSSDIGNFLRYNYMPQISRVGGAVAFSEADAANAENQAKMVSMENARLADLARQENIAPLARSVSNYDLRNAHIREQFAATPDYETAMQYDISQKLVPNIKLGPMQEEIDLVRGQRYVGPRMETNEKQTVNNITVGGKTMSMPGDTLRTSKYIPGTTLTEDVVSRIENPDPSTPRERSPKTAAESNLSLTDEEIAEILRRRQMMQRIPQY